MAVQAPFDERMMVIQQLLSALMIAARICETDQDCVQLHAWLSVFLKGKGAFSEFVNGEHEKLRVKEQMELLTAKEAETLHRALRILDEYEQGMKSERISAVDAQNAWLRTLSGAAEHGGRQCGGAASCTVPRIFLYRGLLWTGAGNDPARNRTDEKRPCDGVYPAVRLYGIPGVRRCAAAGGYG